MAYGMGSHQMYGSGDRVDAEMGYGLPVGARFVGTPRVGLATSQYGRDYHVGYGLGVLEQGKVNFELGSTRSAGRARCWTARTTGSWAGPRWAGRPRHQGEPEALCASLHGQRPYLSDGHHVDEAGNLISCTYVDLRPAAGRLPVGH